MGSVSAKLIVGVNDLESKYPEIAKEWDYALNAPLTPKDFKYGSSKDVWWKCAKHPNIHPSYRTRIAHRTYSNAGCPVCSNRKIIAGINDLATIHKELVKEWDVEKNLPLKMSEVSCSSNKTVWWICPKGHSYKALIYNRTRRGDACPICSGHQIVTGINDLATTHKELVKEWDYEKNGDLLPTRVYKGQIKKVWWKCSAYGHSYHVSVVSRTKKGTGCPYCAGQKILKGFNDIVTLRPDIAKEFDEKKNYPLKVEELTVSNGKKVHWVCKNGHSYEARVSDRTRIDKGHQDCPYCSGRKAWKGENDLATTHPQLIEEWDEKKNLPLKIEDVVAGSHKQVWWVCSKGHSYKQAIEKKTDRGYSCPYCSGQKLLKGFNDLATTHKELIEEWDYEKNGNLLPTMVQKGTHKKIWWKCKTYSHSWKADISSRACNGVGCPICSGHQVLEGFNDLTTTHSALVKEWNYEKNTHIQPTQVTKGHAKKVWWKCSNGHSWQATVASRAINGNGCPNCSGFKGEKLITAICDRNNISYVREYQHHRQLEPEYFISHYRYDFYLNDFDVYVEYDGEQHFKDIKGFAESVKFPTRIKRDNWKNSYVFGNGKPLLRVPYIYDADKNKKDIVNLLKVFLQTKKIPQEIIDFYAKYEFSNYAELAKKWNETRG